MIGNLSSKAPEQLKAERLEREAREREARAEKFLAHRAQWSGWFLIVGGFLLLVGAWFLLFDPGVGGDVVNLQKLYLGQTSALIGAVLFASGALLKYLP